MSRFLIILLLALNVNALYSQSKLSPRARKYMSEHNAAAATRSLSGEKVAAYIYLSAGGDVSALERMGVEVNLRCGNIITARIPADKLGEAAALEEVSYIQTSTPVTGMMDKARPDAGVDLVHQGNGLPRAYTGAGVVVGIIDSGFDYTHPNFYDRDKKELRIKRVWEQGYENGTPPEGFTYGGELKTAAEILTAAGDVTTNSHGTHVAGIAAGADMSGNGYYGIAYDADIVLVSMGGDNTENNVNLSDAISYIYKYAESVGKPCVINMSLGNHAGPHDGTSTFDVLADGMQGKGRLLVGSVGNFGGNKFHAAKTFEEGIADTLRTFIDYKAGLSASTAGGDIEIWGEPGMTLKVNVFTYNKSRGSIAESISVSLPSESEVPDVEKQLQGSVGNMRLYGETSPLNNKPHVLISSAITGLRANYLIGFEVISESAGTVNVWGDNTHVGLKSEGIAGWTDGDDNLSLAEIGGTGHNIISVGAYVTRDEFDTENLGHVSTGETLGGIASFSSCGPTVDGRMKPEISAPGCYTISSVSSNDSYLTSYPLNNSYEWNGKYYYYAYMQGTSMAAPFVAGTVATWLEANPELEPKDVRNILAATARTDEHTGDIAGTGNSEWGYGKIDAYSGIVQALELAAGIDGVRQEQAQDVRITPAGGNKFHLVAGNTASSISINVVNTNGMSVMTNTLPPSDAPTVSTIDLNGLASGIYLIKASSDGWSGTVKATVH